MSYITLTMYLFVWCVVDSVSKMQGLIMNLLKRKMMRVRIDVMRRVMREGVIISITVWSKRRVRVR